MENNHLTGWKKSQKNKDSANDQLQGDQRCWEVTSDNCDNWKMLAWRESRSPRKFPL